MVFIVVKPVSQSLEEVDGSIKLLKLWVYIAFSANANRYKRHPLAEFTRRHSQVGGTLYCTIHIIHMRVYYNRYYYYINQLSRII